MRGDINNYNDIHKAMSNYNLTQTKFLSGTRGVEHRSSANVPELFRWVRAAVSECSRHF